MTALAASVVTTFGNQHWQSYARQMVQSFTAHWPAELPLLVFLDSDHLAPDVEKLLRQQDAVAVHRSKERADFLERNNGKDDPSDYRKQASRFCHKVFALKAASDYWKAAPDEVGKARYLIWLDADVLTTRAVSMAEIQACLPKEGDAAAYLGRKDWPHSECGWLAFDLQNGAHDLIDQWVKAYTSDAVFTYQEWHDSWAFDRLVADLKLKATNLTDGKPGMEIWPQSPMAAWSRHYKGPIAKQELTPGAKPVQKKQQGIQIQTKNSRPNDEIQRNILENQAQIKQWVRKCTETDEEIVVVSAGPMLVPEYLQEEVAAGRKIVAVKHALEPLKKAGIKPWACILLDPRDHVYDFVQNPEKDIIWLVASQVTPKAVKALLDAGCNVWGYHAAVGADEQKYTEKQADAIVSGGSATATRGLFLLEMLGFRKFRLYGYDLCLPDKPNMDEKDEFGQPKHFEVSLETKLPNYEAKRAFWTKAELLAQYQEFQQILNGKPWTIQAFGYGIAPFIAEAKRLSDLREEAKRAKLGTRKPVSYLELLKCRNKTPLWALLPKLLFKTRRKPTKASSF